MSDNRATPLHCRPYQLNELPHEPGLLMVAAHTPPDAPVGHVVYLDYVEDIHAAAHAKQVELRRRFPGYGFSFDAETEVDRVPRTAAPHA